MELDNDIVNSMTEEFKDNGIDSNLIKNVMQDLQDIRNAIIGLNNETKMFSAMIGSGDSLNVFDNKRLIMNQQNDKKQRELLFQAYEKIQLLREYLLGEKLQYHFYVTTKDGEIYRVTFPQEGKSLDEFFRIGKREITLKSNMIKKIKDDDEKAQHLQMYWNQVQKWFKHPEAGDYANSIWISTRRTILRRHDHNPPPPNKGSDQVFNLGHLIEALDAANAQIPPANNFESLFYQALEYDSISGFKGGDNGMIQVKANSARLMRYNTIMNALDSIIELQNNLNNPEKAMQTIRDLYYSSNTSSEIDAKINDFIEKNGDELFKQLNWVVK